MTIYSPTKLASLLRDVELPCPCCDLGLDSYCECVALNDLDARLTKAADRLRSAVSPAEVLDALHVARDLSAEAGLGAYGIINEAIYAAERAYVADIIQGDA